MVRTLNRKEMAALRAAPAELDRRWAAALEARDVSPRVTNSEARAGSVVQDPAEPEQVPVDEHPARAA